jgi:hypothetical protein
MRIRLQTTLWRLLVILLLTVGCNSTLFDVSGDSRRGQIATVPTNLNDGNNDTPPSPVVRPDNQVFIQNDFCICQNKKAKSFGNCANFCKDKNDNEPALYVNTQLGPDIELNPELQNLNGWCNAQIDDGNINPNCKLKVSSGLQSQQLAVNLFSDTNSFKVNLVELPENVIFTAQLIETTSKAKSTTFQIVRKNFADIDPNLPIPIIPVHNYTCFNTAGTYDGENRTYDFMVRQYFTYPNNNSPPSVPPGNLPPNLYCHDWFTLGSLDKSNYPRLETITHHLHFWNGNDARFFDLDSNTNLDINDYIKTELQSRFGISTPNNLIIFEEFNWPSFPQISNSAEFGSSVTSMGYYMQAFVDSNNPNNVFCPTQSTYDNLGGVFEIIGEEIGAIDTEAIFVAKREQLPFIDSGGNPIPAPDSFMLIRESDLNQIWFYFDEDGLAIEADSASSKTQTIHFYWPPCETSSCNPTTKQADQALFTIRKPEDLFAAPSTFGFRNTILPADKRFGCIPKG